MIALWQETLTLSVVLLNSNCRDLSSQLSEGLKRNEDSARFLLPTFPVRTRLGCTQPTIHDAQSDSGLGRPCDMEL